MSGEHQHTATAFGGALIVLQPVIFHKCRYIGSRDLWELGEFDKKLAEISEHLSHDHVSVGLSESRQRKAKVYIANPAKPRMKIVCNSADHPAHDHR